MGYTIERSSAEKPGVVPNIVEKRRKRADEGMNERRPEVEECLEFWRGNQWVHKSSKGDKLVQLSTVTGPAGGKPPHRIRNSWNLIHGIIEGKVSAATQRTPAYTITPSKQDPNIVGGAEWAQRVAYHGYEQWYLQRRRAQAVTLALVTGEGFYYPYFDPSVGPFLPKVDGQGQVVGRQGAGEIKVLVLAPDSVGWEPGVDFLDARWYVVRRAVAPDEIQQWPGYIAGKLECDAVAEDRVGKGAGKAKLAFVYEYLERPTADKPDGRRIVMSNGRPILPEEPYPVFSPDGTVLDEPALVRLSYTVDPLLDHDRGLVGHLLDPQRTINDCQSKISEWKNRCLNPQMKAPVGSMVTRRTDEPGVINYYNAVGGKEPEWERVPPIPAELFTLMETARSYMLDISAAGDIPTQIESGKGVQAFLEQMQSRWQAFIAAVAEADAALMRRCLMLVQRYYTEPRMLKIRGSMGWERYSDFMGTMMMGQDDVTVLPSSITPRTREQVQQMVQWIVQVFPGYLRPEVALSAIQAGQGEQLIDSYERDIARAWNVIQMLKAEPEVFLSAPSVMSPDGQSMVPSWAPREFDNVDVHKAVFEEWMKTPEYDDSDPVAQEAANLYYQALLWLEEQRDAREAAKQTEMAQQLGAANAARPTMAPMPSVPSPGGP